MKLVGTLPRVYSPVKNNKMHPRRLSLLQHTPLIPLGRDLRTFFSIVGDGVGVEQENAFFPWNIRADKPGVPRGKERSFCQLSGVLYPRLFCLRGGSNAFQTLFANIANTISDPFDNHLSANRIVAEC